MAVGPKPRATSDLIGGRMRNTTENDRMQHLEDRLKAAKAAQEPAPSKEDHHAMANMAWRMVIELVAGIAIGFGIGYSLDWLFGTMPIFLILFIGLGLAAGIKTMMRTAQEVQEMQVGHTTKDEEG